MGLSTTQNTKTLYSASLFDSPEMSSRSAEPYLIATGQKNDVHLALYAMQKAFYLAEESCRRSVQRCFCGPTLVC